ncbi:MAG: hypothetical protein F7C38_02760 [Desulfurococcales archaeon]|nr:hypothetical protein [Desulfurococcales archaeon]
MSSSGGCDRESILGLVDVILREDLEGLARGYSFDERLEFWNDLKAQYNQYIRGCAARFSREIDRLIRGKFRLAQLMIAASFKVNGEELPEVTGRFSDEEYQVLFDLEELKELDFLSVDDLVEFIERREGKVYEMVKKYYERGYHMLDTKWTNIMGALALAMAERYKERRLKIEEAVVKYIRKKPLTIFISEIEEAVKKALEAGEARREASQTIEKIAGEIDKIEPVIAGSGGIEEAIESREKALTMIEKLLKELDETRGKLREKEAELERLASQYTESSSAREIVEAELEALKGRVRELEALLEEYKAAVATLKAEKEALAERLEELKAGLEGRGGGNLVSREEAWALENALVERIVRKLAEGAVVYDPVRGESREVKWNRRVYYSLHGDGKPQGRGVQLQSLRGVFKKRKELVVDAVTLVHRDSFDEKGWDQEPVGLGEVMEVVESRLEEAGRGGYYHILVLSSPTGFTEKARMFVESNDYLVNLASRHVTVYLVDPVKGQLYYNSRDEAAEANKHLADPRLPEERVKRVLEYLRSEEAKEKAVLIGGGSPFLLAEDIAKATGEDLEIVARAMARAEEEGLGRVMVTSDGLKALFYKH